MQIKFELKKEDYENIAKMSINRIRQMIEEEIKDDAFIHKLINSLVLSEFNKIRSEVQTLVREEVKVQTNKEIWIPQ